MATFSLCSNLPPDYDKEQTSPLASLEARWPAEQAFKRAALRAIRSKMLLYGP